MNTLQKNIGSGISLFNPNGQRGGYQSKKEKMKGDWIQTVTGRKFYPLDPKNSVIDIEVIAHSLSLLCRFNGHCKTFYSVAHRSLLVYELLKREAKVTDPNILLWGLLHDAPEAYLSDIPRPLKYQPEMNCYREAEDIMMSEIARVFKLRPKMPIIVKDMDLLALAIEKQYLMEAMKWDMRLPEVSETHREFLDVFMSEFEWRSIKKSFMHHFILVNSTNN